MDLYDAVSEWPLSLFLVLAEVLKQRSDFNLSGIGLLFFQMGVALSRSFQ